MAQPSGLASQHVATAWQKLVTDDPTDNINLRCSPAVMRDV